MNAPYQDYAALYDPTGQSRFGLRMVRYARQLWDLADHRVETLLELACGTGSAAVAFANRGASVTAVDRSEAMLEVARAKALHWEAPVTFRCQDMRELDAGIAFDAATCFYDSLNYMLVPEDLEKVFVRVKDSLRPGGLFVFDVISDHGLAEGWGDSVETRVDDQGARIWRSSFDLVSRVGTLEIDHFAREAQSDVYRRVRETHRHRGYSLFEVREALERAGMECVNAYRALTFDPVGATTYRIAYMARRPD